MIFLSDRATDSDKIQVVKSVVQDVLGRRRPHMDRIRRNIDLYHGRLFRFGAASGHIQESFNLIGPMVDTMTSFLAGGNPEFEPWPMDGSAYSDETYKVATSLARGYWYRQGCRSTLDVFVRDVLIQGLGVFGLDPPDEEDDEPDIAVRPIDVFSAGFDLSAGSWDLQKGQFFVELYMMQTKLIEQKWGKKVEPSHEHTQELDLDRRDVTAPISARTSTPGGQPHRYNADGDVLMGEESDLVTPSGYYNRDESLVVRLWFRDARKKKHEERYQIQAGGQEVSIPYSEDRQVFPGGIRCLTIANDVLLEDAASPFQRGWLRGKYPILQGNYIRRGDVPYGIGMPDRLEAPQMEFARKMNLLLDWLNQIPKSPIILPKNCGVDDGKITRYAGLKLHPKPQFARLIRFLETPMISPVLPLMIDKLGVLMERIGGVNDVTEGRIPGQITAASAIMALQEKAKQKHQHAVRNLEGTITDFGNAILAGMEQYYTQRRAYYNVDDIGSPELVTFQGQQAFIPALVLSEGRHRVKMRAASMLETSRYALTDLLMKLYATPISEDGLVSADELLDSLDIPGRERIKANLLMRQELQEMRSAMDTMAVGPGGLPPMPGREPAGLPPVSVRAGGVRGGGRPDFRTGPPPGGNGGEGMPSLVKRMENIREKST